MCACANWKVYFTVLPTQWIIFLLIYLFSNQLFLWVEHCPNKPVCTNIQLFALSWFFLFYFSWKSSTCYNSYSMNIECLSKIPGKAHGLKRRPLRMHGNIGRDFSRSGTRQKVTPTCTRFFYLALKLWCCSGIAIEIGQMLLFGCCLYGGSLNFVVKEGLFIETIKWAFYFKTD